MNRRLLLGDEAVALGAIHAGLSGVYAYPGTPSTEITEYIQGNKLARERGIHSRWCTNEKTAMEAALGMSYAGRRALVCMKHVGMNVCADAFVNSAITGVGGGLVVLAADDPSMHSSQNEQDSRFYGKFAMIPILEPSNQQEAYDMTRYAFDLSEQLRVPVLLRIVTRLAHSRAAVEVGDVREVNALNPSTDQWVLLPGIARRKYISLINKQVDMNHAAEQSAFNRCGQKKSRLGIIACGIAYNYVMENKADETDVLKLSQYPLPEDMVFDFALAHDCLLVAEDGQPFVEELVKRLVGATYPVLGRLTGQLPRTGELTPDCLRPFFTDGQIDTSNTDVKANEASQFAVPDIVAPRPPQLCKGCGHRDVYAALNQVLADYPDHRVFGDIGCYTLGALPPFKALSSCVDMGASITMAKGAADAGLYPAVAIIGDSTFTHSGMTGLLDAVNDKSNITVVISDNLTTGMTGGQDSAGTSKYEAICTALGVEPEHVRVVVPLPKNMPEITRILREEIEYIGVSVIIPRRECIQTAARHAREKKK
ncbi:MAG: indolepyruvate ferredoxin oxidoreductase [Bacteroidaceae bacterium]|nr:indolepyruvate ferredoxin oxidoreductase [Bacteroidaceae bacterium]